MISFNSVPNNLRVPFAAVEFDNSKSSQGDVLMPYKGLIIGQKTSAGSATANSVYTVTSADQVVALAGRGSILHRQAVAWFRNNQYTPVLIGVLADNGSGVLATGTLTVTGPSTAAGTISLYIGGQLVQVAVASGDSANTIASAIDAAVTAKTDLMVTSGVASAVVTLTAKNKGTHGNSIDVRVNYQDGEALPAGVGVAVVAMASGATNPTLTTLISGLGDNWFHILAHPYTDSTSLTAIEAELVSRFGPSRMIDGVAFTAANGTQSTLGTLGLTRNCPHSVIMSNPGKNPLTPPCEVAAATAAAVAFYANIDPARPLQTLPLIGVLKPIDADLFTTAERNLNLFDGIGTTKCVGNQVQIERAVTTYQTNASGSADTSYLDVNTMLTLMYLRYSFRTDFSNRHLRSKLADDGTMFGAGQDVVTPLSAKGEALTWFRTMEKAGLVENFDQFKRDLVVERNASDPNRLDFLLPPDLINQLIVTAAKMQFRL